MRGKPKIFQLRLNPCSNGIRKYPELGEGWYKPTGVLILVLMEYENTKRESESGQSVLFVLILVLMEYENTRYLGKDKTSRTRLNPCSNGIRKYIYIVKQRIENTKS